MNHYERIAQDLDSLLDIKADLKKELVDKLGPFGNFPPNVSMTEDQLLKVNVFYELSFAVSNLQNCLIHFNLAKSKAGNSSLT